VVFGVMAVVHNTLQKDEWSGEAEGSRVIIVILYGFVMEIGDLMKPYMKHWRNGGIRSGANGYRC